MTLTEAYEALIKLSQPKKFKRYDDMCHGDGKETSTTMGRESESETLPLVWQNLIPDCLADLHLDVNRKIRF